MKVKTGVKAGDDKDRLDWVDGLPPGYNGPVPMPGNA